MMPIAQKRIVYTGECECPQCGCGSKDLKPEYLPWLMKEFGKWVQLRCCICDGEWCQPKTEETK